MTWELIVLVIAFVMLALTVFALFESLWRLEKGGLTMSEYLIKVSVWILVGVLCGRVIGWW